MDKWILQIDGDYWRFGVPEGFELVETDAHKKQRLEQQVENYKTNLKYHERKVQELSKALEDEEKELLELSK